MSHPEITVERLEVYQPEDARDLGVLRGFMSPKFPTTPLPEKMIRDHTENPDQRALIVARLRTSGQIVSSETVNMICSPDAGDIETGRMAWLGLVSTHKDWRRRGIYTEVWNEGLRWCGEHEVSVLEFHSNPGKDYRQDAIRFYTGHGAVPLDTQPFAVNVQELLARL